MKKIVAGKEMQSMNFELAIGWFFPRKLVRNDQIEFCKTFDAVQQDMILLRKEKEIPFWQLLAS